MILNYKTIVSNTNLYHFDDKFATFCSNYSKGWNRWCTNVVSWSVQQTADFMIDIGLDMYFISIFSFNAKIEIFFKILTFNQNVFLSSTYTEVCEDVSRTPCGWRGSL